MTPAVEALLADHAARIATVEREQESISKKLDKLIFGMLGTLGSAVVGLAIQLIALLKHG